MRNIHPKVFNENELNSTNRVVFGGWNGLLHHSFKKEGFQFVKRFNFAMAPKKKELSKSEMKKVEKFVEDKTFGLKNKNKSI